MRPLLWACFMVIALAALLVWLLWQLAQALYALSVDAVINLVQEES